MIPGRGVEGPGGGKGGWGQCPATRGVELESVLPGLGHAAYFCRPSTNREVGGAGKDFANQVFPLMRSFSRGEP
jgi:hypothetical protein